MFRIFYFLISALLLLMSFTEPQSKWSVGGVELYGYFFVFCIVVYVPLMAAALLFFARSLVVIVKTRKLRNGVMPLVSAFAGAIALYEFNYWVFNVIY